MLIRTYTHWVVKKYNQGETVPFEVIEFDGNVLLNEGINALWTLLAGGIEDAFDNTNSYIGVGDGTAGESAGHVGLQGANKVYVGMQAAFPTYGADQSITWQAVFGAGVGTFAWQEYTVANGNSDAATNLLRKVQSLGTKAAASTWTLTVTRTLA